MAEYFVANFSGSPPPLSEVVPYHGPGVYSIVEWTTGEDFWTQDIPRFAFVAAAVPISVMAAQLFLTALFVTYLLVLVRFWLFVDWAVLSFLSFWRGLAFPFSSLFGYLGALLGRIYSLPFAVFEGTLNFLTRVLGMTLNFTFVGVPWWALNMFLLPAHVLWAIATTLGSYWHVDFALDVVRVDGEWKSTRAFNQPWAYFRTKRGVFVAMLVAGLSVLCAPYLGPYSLTPAPFLSAWLFWPRKRALHSQTLLTYLQASSDASNRPAVRQYEALARGTALALSEDVATVAACGELANSSRIRPRGRFTNRLQHALGERSPIVGAFLRRRWTPDLPSSARTPAVAALLLVRQGRYKVLGAGTFPTASGTDGDFVLVESQNGDRRIVVLNLLFRLVTYATFRPRDDDLRLGLKSRAVAWLKDVEAPEWVGPVAIAPSMADAWEISPVEAHARETMVEEVADRSSL